MRALRHAPDNALPRDSVIPEWPDADQRERAITTLLADGLVRARGDVLELPR